MKRQYAVKVYLDGDYINLIHCSSYADAQEKKKLWATPNFNGTDVTYETEIVSIW